MRTLITGATGFIGGHVAEVGKRAGDSVRALSRPTSDTSHLESVGVEIAVGDVTNPDSLGAACEDIDVVVHTAAVVGNYGDWEHYRAIGVDGTRNVLEAAIAAGVPKLVHVGSVAVYGFRHPDGVVLTEATPYDEEPEPWNHYVREKVESEKIVWRAHRDGRIGVTSIRPSVVLGVRDRNVVNRIIRVLRAPLGGLIGWGRNRVACVVVEELAELIVRAAKTEAALGRAYNASGSKTITQKELLFAFSKASGIRVQPWRAPRSAMMLASAVLERAYRAAGRDDEPYTTRMGIDLFGRDYVVDCSRVRRELGFSGEADYHEAIAESVAYYLDNEPERGFVDRMLSRR